MKKITVKDIRDRKTNKAAGKIVALTAYDFPFAQIVDQAGIDIILVGDSLGMVCLGYDSTVPVTMRDMLHHVKAVSRAVEHGLIVADMPFGAYSTPEQAYRNAKRFIQQAGAHAVKLEGAESVLKQIHMLIQNGIPVMGHIGMTPQTANQLGGYKVQGKTPKEAQKLLQQAKLLEEAGVFSLVLECIPSELARKITKSVSIPTIGIGAGIHTDGQVLVLHDVLGFDSKVKPRFVRRYAQLGETINQAVRQFRADVINEKYPKPEESYGSQ